MGRGSAPRTLPCGSSGGQRAGSACPCIPCTASEGQTFCQARLPGCSMCGSSVTDREGLACKSRGAYRFGQERMKACLIY